MIPSIRLRPMGAHDAEALLDLEHRPEVNRYQSYPPFDRTQAETYAREAEESWASGDNPAWQEFVIEADGAWAGRIGFEHAEGRATVWFAVLPAFQGRGIGRAALRELAKRLKVWQVREVWGYCDPENTPSARLMASVGFEEQAREENGDRAFCFRLASQVSSP